MLLRVAWRNIVESCPSKAAPPGPEQCGCPATFHGNGGPQKHKPTLATAKPGGRTCSCMNTGSLPSDWRGHRIIVADRIITDRTGGRIGTDCVARARSPVSVTLSSTKT